MLKARGRMITALLAVCAVSLTILLLWTLSGAAADPAAPKNTVKWEYAVFFGGNADIVSFLEPGAKAVRGESWEDLARKLGGAGSGSGSLDVVNAIGKRGWELVSVGPSSLAGGGTDYYFKRPAQ